MRIFASTAALFALTFSALAMPPVPRKSPEFAVTDAAGKQILLSSLKGKVVVIPFMFTTCPHCQSEAKMLTKLQSEVGPGVAILGVAFNDGVNAATVNQFVREFGVGFPVGFATRDAVISYLGLSVMDRWVVPQVAVIDKKGNVVAQSQPSGSPELQEENSLRALLMKLLKEPAGNSSAAPAAKTTAKRN